MTRNIQNRENKNVINLTEKAYQGIRQMFFHNEIAPGQKIGYHHLTQRLGMSPTPVIQALKLLEVQGLVRHEPNRGYYTEPISVVEVQEIYDLRQIIEVSLLPKTIKTLDEKGKQRLLSTLQNHIESLDRTHPSKGIVTDMELHIALASLSGAHIQLRMLRQLFDLLYLKYRSSILFSTTFKQVRGQHNELIDAVISQDLRRSKKALTYHINDVKEHVIRGLGHLLDETEISNF